MNVVHWTILRFCRRAVVLAVWLGLAWWIQPATGAAAEGATPAGYPSARYQPVENGYRIVGSMELFNRALYGGHEQDGLPERYFTLAGDQPLILGAITDWRKHPACLHAKCGTLMLGMAMDHEVGYPVVGGATEDRFSQWFHKSRGTVTTFRNGWMEYDVRPYFQCAATVRAEIEVLPLQAEAGYVCHLRVRTDQQVHLVIGFGGLTDFLARFEFPSVRARYFSAENCKGDRVTPGQNRAWVEGPDSGAIKSRMLIGTSFPVEVSRGDPAKALVFPGKFLQRGDYAGDAPMVRMHCAVGPGRPLDGRIIVLRNSDEAVLDRLLGEPNQVAKLKQAIRSKQAAIEIDTPDPLLNLTIPPNVLAMDACWHGRTFHHGAIGWHAPYMGWRHWYGPTVIGWHDRVAKAIRTHAATQVMPADLDPSKERVVQSGGPYSRLENSYGYIPGILGQDRIFYNMQEVYVDHFLHHLEWTGDLELAREVFPVIARVLDWEARILDAESDGLYQNWLNTWISDAHSYNGGNCTQASAYNYRANRKMARIAELLGEDPKPFARRGERTYQAAHETLWLPERGVMAEYVDTIGNKLVHPSPELASIYHSIEAELVDPFQAYQMLRFTETDLRNERTAVSDGRLVWSSNWYPQVYSCCGLYTAENLHLAWAYFRCGMAAQAYEILKGVVDAHFLCDSPGSVGHCMTGSGYSSGAIDFSENPSLVLRTVVEGLFGVRFELLDEKITIAPNLPAEWARARLKIPDITLDYRRQADRETWTINCAVPARRTIRLAMRRTEVEQVTLDGTPCDYRIEPRLGRSDVVVETDRVGKLVLVVDHAGAPLPQAEGPGTASPGDTLTVTVQDGVILDAKTPSGFLNSLQAADHSLTGHAKNLPGWHTLFLRVRRGQWEGWIPWDVRVGAKLPPLPAEQPKGEFVPVDLKERFNIKLADVHQLEYRKPRPAGHSIMVQLDGRFLWDWNQAGYQTVRVDDSRLRSCGGVFTTPSGIPFITPAEGNNAACASVWDNFPEELSVPVSGRGSELAVLLVGVTNPMQARVENGRLTVRYQDGSEDMVKLINPKNFDDWLVAATQTENETVYFSDYNHALVQRIRLDPSKELATLTARATANEVIIALLGLSVRREQ